MRRRTNLQQGTCEINAEHLGPHTKILGKLLCVERGTHEDDREVVSMLEYVLHDDEQNVRLQVPLVDLVQHQVADTGQQSDTHTKTGEMVLSLWLILGVCTSSLGLKNGNSVSILSIFDTSAKMTNVFSSVCQIVSVFFYILKHNS